jgi:hypothetical protein
MSPKSRGFRPSVRERLEDRVVLTGPSTTLALGIQLGVAPAVDAQVVGNAFAAFEQTFNTDVKTVLLAGNAVHTTDFQTALNNALIVLNNTITGALGNLPPATSPASAITAELIGLDKSTLQSRLFALKQPTSAQSHVTRLYTATADAIILSVDYQVTSMVANTTPPPGTVTVAQFQTVLSNVSTDIQNFAKAYSKDLSTVLLAFPTTNPSANAVAFNAAVAADLQTMTGKILQDVAALPAPVAQTLNASIPNSILTNQTNAANLQDALAGIPVPMTITFNALSNYNKAATKAINAGVNAIVVDLFTAVQSYNTNLPAGSTG